MHCCELHQTWPQIPKGLEGEGGHFWGTPLIPDKLLTSLNPHTGDNQGIVTFLEMILLEGTSRPKKRRTGNAWRKQYLHEGHELTLL